MGAMNVYIDGFNLYHGVLKANPVVKWLNLESYFSTMLPKGHTLNRIRYFTAPVDPRPNDPNQPARQAVYLEAIQTLPSVSVHKGQFKTRATNAPLANNPNRIVQIIKVEEKGSDVNLATMLLLDAVKEDMDVALVVTDDFDQIMPLRRVKSDLGRSVGIASPRKRPHLGRTVGASFYKPIDVADLARHQLPDPVRGPKGLLHRPHSWA